METRTRSATGEALRIPPGHWRSKGGRITGAPGTSTAVERVAEGPIVCAWQHTSQAGSSPARPGATGQYPQVGVMPHRPQPEAGMAKPTRARRRKLETAKADLEPP